MNHRCYFRSRTGKGLCVEPVKYCKNCGHWLCEHHWSAESETRCIGCHHLSALGECYLKKDDGCVGRERPPVRVLPDGEC